MYSNFPIYEEIAKIIHGLISNNFLIVFKYHPSDSSKQFDSLAEKHPDNFVISSESIETLANSTDIVITLLSAGILKTIALQKTSFIFIPNTLKKGLQKSTEFFRSVYFTDSSLSTTWVDDFCNKFSNINEFILILSDKSNLNRKYSNFMNCFEPADSSNRIINYLEEFPKLKNIIK